MIKEDLIILGVDGCPPCEILKKSTNGKVPIYDISQSDDAYKLAQNMEVTGIPTALEKNGEDWSKCNISYEDKKVVIKCKNKKLEFKVEQ